MDKSRRDQVYALALKVRKAVEKQVEPGHDLTGWCAKASAMLFDVLGQHKIAAELHLQEHSARGAHVFVVVDDHIVDVTATQFHELRKQPVVIMHECEAEVYAFYQTDKVFRKVSDLTKLQKKRGWPDWQVVAAK